MIQTTLCAVTLLIKTIWCKDAAAFGGKITCRLMFQMNHPLVFNTCSQMQQRYLNAAAVPWKMTAMIDVCFNDGALSD